MILKYQELTGKESFSEFHWPVCLFLVVVLYTGFNNNSSLECLLFPNETEHSFSTFNLQLFFIWWYPRKALQSAGPVRKGAVYEKILSSIISCLISEHSRVVRRFIHKKLFSSIFFPCFQQVQHQCSRFLWLRGIWGQSNISYIGWTLLCATGNGRSHALRNGQSLVHLMAICLISIMGLSAISKEMENSRFFYLLNLWFCWYNR